MFDALAGFGHRISMSESKVETMKFGGFVVPEKIGGRPMTERQMDDYDFRYAPAGIRG